MFTRIVCDTVTGEALGSRTRAHARQDGEQPVPDRRGQGGARKVAFVKTRISDMSEQGRKNLAEYRLSISLFTF